MSDSVVRNDNFLSKARKLSILPTPLDIFDIRQHYVRILYTYPFVSVFNHMKSLPNDFISAFTKLISFADKILNESNMMNFRFQSVETVLVTRENAANQFFSPLLTMFATLQKRSVF